MNVGVTSGFKLRRQSSQPYIGNGQRHAQTTAALVRTPGTHGASRSWPPRARKTSRQNPLFVPCSHKSCLLLANDLSSKQCLDLKM
ncbi:hypothetical protein Hypma_013823 [Hypsizygus marmoreus]|uniref:Uncharacterized protein n=1 Tax=Hypsizygus marmoreus TaxID=39966 RepID=A0A369K8Y0_HYPMA|nr:hypothetical protein Hypma_013823 [Hypsizygus marmoreus]